MYDPESKAQHAADAARACLVSVIAGRIVIVLPLDPSASDETIAQRVERVSAALANIRFEEKEAK
jgi:hypothetical protein